MPVTFKDTSKLTPVTDAVEHVKVELDLTPIKLDLSIPKSSSLPFGLMTELFVLQNKRLNEEIGQSEYFLKLFCLFTQRLPTNEHVSYSALKNLTFPEGVEGMREQMQLVATLMQSVNQLLGALNLGGGEGKAPKEKAKLKN